jgi:hypothetical protein
MAKLGPDPGATGNPPSWLVFDDDDPWLMFGAGLELSDAWSRRRWSVGAEGCPTWRA